MAKRSWSGRLRAAMLVLVLQTLDLLGESGDILAYPVTARRSSALCSATNFRNRRQFLTFLSVLGTLITSSRSTETAR